ncbi:MAG: response regulator [Thermogemmatispora sp.]|uniref:response regulator transcription factor n=1 Tax=Thermogemmatispora sp. TaxID=1968838 RepID=UPI00262D03A1|nr:response regulator [Thermogemmatispora sp.]MBX5456608.1 response regulator [Thermogemmatispora sp.]
MKRIIVVDDDKETREIITFVLSRNGFEVVTAADGRQLAALLEVERPDLIILDVMMPGLDGYQIFNRLRHDPVLHQIPVIIMTAHAEHIYERISVDLGAADHITKPFHPLELVEKVKGLFRMLSCEASWDEVK